MTLTKGLLHSYHKQIVQLQQGGSVLAELMKGRIADFYKENQVYIDALNRDIDFLKKEFLLTDENGKVIFDADQKIQFLEGKSEYQFNKNWDALMATSVLGKWGSEDFEEPTTETVSE